jgi:PAS domain S-box-containing protein
MAMSEEKSGSPRPKRATIPRIVATSIVAVGGGLASRALLERGLGIHAPYLAFFPWLAAAAGIAGGWAGLLSLGGFVIAGAYWLEPTTFVPTRTPAVGLSVFATGGLVVVSVASWGMWAMRNMSEHRRAERELADANRHFRVLTETVPDFVWWCAADGPVQYLNPQYTSYTGVAIDRINAGGWHEAVHPDDHAPVERAWAASLRQGKPFELEYRFRRHHDGQYRWFLTRTVPVRNDKGEVLRWVGAATDVHDSKLAREEREKLLAAERSARQEAERAGRVKDEFLAVLSHELRTPLTPVLMTVSLIEQNPDLPESMREDIASIRRNVELEARLIDDLLDLTRIARGKIRYDFQPIDVHLLIRSALSICCSDGKHQVISDMRAVNSYVRGDAARLQQVFWNLLNNAWKFTPPGGKVTISTRSDGHNVSVCVADNGIGIDPQVLPRVFDAFEQGDAILARNFGGLGLGLAICKALVAAHGGSITAHSEGKDRGASFTVELPSVQAPESVDHKPMLPAQTEQQRTLRMLLVEDHPPTLRALLKLLKSIGHDVDGVGSVADGLQAAQSSPYDLLISDLGLPDGSGYELMRQLRQSQGLRGIALSGYGMEDDLERSRAAGFSEHLVKPVDLQILRDAIARVADGARAT